MIDFLVTAAVSAAVFGLLGVALNVQWGYGGLVNLGLVGFFAVGAYTTAMASIEPAGGLGLPALRDDYLFGWGLPFWVAVTVGALVAAAFAALLAFLVLRARLSENYLGIMTLAFGQTAFLLAASEKWLVNSFDGLTGVPPPMGAVDAASYDEAFLAVAVVVALAVGLVLRALWRSPFGRAMRVVREDAAVAEAMGFDAMALQVATFAIGGAVAGLAGGLWAGFLGSITPNAFTIQETLIVLAAVVVGGVGNQVGTYVGAAVVIGLVNQGSRFLTWPEAIEEQVPALRLIVVGLLLILVLRFRPEGIVPEPLVRVRRPTPSDPGSPPTGSDRPGGSGDVNGADGAGGSGGSGGATGLARAETSS